MNVMHVSIGSSKKQPAGEMREKLPKIVWIPLLALSALG
jgi:hypothetical protein